MRQYWGIVALAIVLMTGEAAQSSPINWPLVQYDQDAGWHSAGVVHFSVDGSSAGVSNEGPSASNGGSVSPVAISSAVLLHTGKPVQSLFGSAPVDADTHVMTQGSAIFREFAGSQGDRIEFTWNFQTGERAGLYDDQGNLLDSPFFDPFPDFAFMAVLELRNDEWVLVTDEDWVTLAQATDQEGPGGSWTWSATGFSGLEHQTGDQQQSYTLPTAGTFLLIISVMDVIPKNDPVFTEAITDSMLLVSGVQFISASQGGGDDDNGGGSQEPGGTNPDWSDPTHAPEPSSLALFAVGALALAGRQWRQRRRQRPGGHV